MFKKEERGQKIMGLRMESPSETLLAWQAKRVRKGGVIIFCIGALGVSQL